MELLKPDAGKLLYLVLGAFVLPRVLATFRSKAG